MTDDVAVQAVLPGDLFMATAIEAAIVDTGFV
jgi:hypothetical protein